MSDRVTKFGVAPVAPIATPGVPYWVGALPPLPRVVVMLPVVLVVNWTSQSPSPTPGDDQSPKSNVVVLVQRAVRAWLVVTTRRALLKVPLTALLVMSQMLSVQVPEPPEPRASKLVPSAAMLKSRL